MPHNASNSRALRFLPGPSSVMRTSFLLACLLLTACASRPAEDAAAATYLLVRHAEKDTTVAKDPPLTAAGQARAERLAVLLANTPLTAIYSTPTRRTRQTATPTAQLHGLPIEDYTAADATVVAARLRKTHPVGTVLIVGHSDTLPPLARALCHCNVSDMDERVYGIRYTVTVDANGHTQLREDHD